MKKLNIKEKYKSEVIESMLKKHNYKNVMSVPKISKVVINRGMGEAVSNSKVIDYTVEQIKSITGQKPVLTKAKKSVSNFKIREKQVIGAKVTLRSAKMYDFLTKLIHIALPKIRDFRGVSKNAFDGRGNYTLGIKEDALFPEVKHDAVDKPRGFDVTIVTTANTDEEAYDLLELMGMPFRKN